MSEVLVIGGTNFVSSSLAKHLIKDGFHVPNISLEEGLSKTYRWYVEACPKYSDGRMTMVEELSR